MEKTVLPARSSSALQYTPLDDSRNEIRLLEIVPTEDPLSPVQCILRHHVLDNKLEYTALSYVWGDPEITAPVFVNGCKAQVTTNLRDALLQLRESGIKSLWADALCIDQRNLKERGHQVQKMGTIYKSASQVISWLGPGGEDTSCAFQKIREFAHVYRTFLAEHIANKIELGDIYGFYGHYIENDFLCSLDEWQSMQRVFDQPYWSRIWIIQEVVVAKRVNIMCGKNVLAWNEFTHAQTFVNSVAHTLGRNPDLGRQNIPKMVRRNLATHSYSTTAANGLIQSYNESRDGIDLTEIAMAYGNSQHELQSSDEKDRIYGILGLLKSSYKSSILVNYAVSTRSVFIQALRVMLTNNGPDVLCLCGLSFSNSNKYPSWTLDWEFPRRRDHWLLERGLKVTNFTFLSVEKDTIELEAIKVDIVARIFNLKYVDEGLDKLEDEIMQRVEGSSYRLFSPSDVRETIRRTLVCDRDIETFEMPADEKWGQVFEEMISTKRKLRKVSKNQEQSCYAGDRAKDSEWSSDGNESAYKSSNCMRRTLRGILFITSQGYVGLASHSVEVGDEVYVFRQGRIPFVLRPKEDMFQLVCGSYMHGFRESKFVDENQSFGKVRLC